jgi:type II secretory pathway pseudopilin PulG
MKGAVNPMFPWRRFHNKKSSAGFALVDIIIGIAILSVALVGIAFAWRQSTVTTISARNYNQATYYAQQALEILKVNDGRTSATLAVPWAATTNIAQSGVMPAFTVATAVLTAGEAPEYDALSADTRAKTVPVRATVTWQESGGASVANRTLTVVSYYYLK